MMKSLYKIRTANPNDKIKIQDFVRHSIAKDKSLLSPDVVKPGFVEDFVDKIIRKGDMLVVENSQSELELIGEVHYYFTSANAGQEGLKEFTFIPGLGNTQKGNETELVNWLFAEIKKKHKDVFRVELSAFLYHSSSVDHFREMGIVVEGDYQRRLQNKAKRPAAVVPLSWINPSFN